MNDNLNTTNDTLETTDGRQSLRFERRLDHSIERVWRAVSEPAELECWFPAAAEWTPASGEVFEAAGASGEVMEVDPPNRLAWMFAGEHYSFDLQARDGGCLLVFTHTFDDLPVAQAAAGWHTYLSRLEPHLAGDELSEEEAHGPWEEVHEAYARRFAVDPTPGREFIAAYRVSTAG